MIVGAMLYILLQVSLGVAIWNVVVFGMYGLDKRRAKNGGWRVKEGTLIGLAFFMGSLGAIAGMFVFRHKTSKLKFKVLVPLAFVFNVLVVLAGLYFLV